MKNKKIIWVGVGLLALVGLGVLGYKLFGRSGTKSNDPEKNNRKIILNKV
jgi:hypothetical protein